MTNTQVYFYCLLINVNHNTHFKFETPKKIIDHRERFYINVLSFLSPIITSQI